MNHVQAKPLCLRENFVRFRSGIEPKLIESSSDARALTLPQPPRFELLTRLPGQSAHLIVSGDMDSVYEIHGSSNLLDWTLLGTVTNMADTFEFIDASAATVSERYYRAKFVP